MAARYERGLFDPEAPRGRVPVRPHHLGDRLATATSRRASPPRPPRWPATRSSATWSSLYDDNHISIEGDTATAVSEDVAEAVRGVRLARPARRRPQPNGDLDVARARTTALEAAQAETDRPSFIAMRTIIAWPAPNAQNTEAAHGSALGDDEVAATKRVLGFDPEQTFEVADEVLAHTREALDRGRRGARRVGEALRRVARPPARARRRCSTGSPPASCPRAGRTRSRSSRPGKGVATRAASGKVLQALGAVHPRAVGRLRRPRRLQQHHHRQDVARSCPRATRCRRPTRTAARSTSASASTPWARR